MTKQSDLPGVENQNRIPALTKLAEEYEDARDKWIRASNPMMALQDKLMSKMKAEGLTIYRDGDLVVERQVSKEKVKVKRQEPAEPKKAKGKKEDSE